MNLQRKTNKNVFIFDYNIYDIGNFYYITKKKILMLRNL